MVLATDTKTTAEAAAALGVSVRSIHRMVNEGRLTPLMKAPGKRGAYFFHAAEVARAVAVAGKTGP